MQIDYAIFATDNNSLYNHFWEITSEVCLKVLGVTPVLFNICDQDSDFYEDKYGIIKKIKSVEFFDTGFQSQIVRMYGCKYFPENVCITCDLDMIMISRSYFIDQVIDFDDDSFIIYSSDAYANKGQHRYPICYNAAKGKHFNSVLDCDVSFQEYVYRLDSFLSNWACDEIYFTKKLDSSDFSNVVKLSRGWNRRTGIANGRIDRASWSWRKGVPYIDCHCLRPYVKYKSELDNLKNVILEGGLS